jgi:hypothetical protein
MRGVPFWRDRPGGVDGVAAVDLRLMIGCLTIGGGMERGPADDDWLTESPLAPFIAREGGKRRIVEYKLWEWGSWRTDGNAIIAADVADKRR